MHSNHPLFTLLRRTVIMPGKKRHYAEAFLNHGFVNTPQLNGDDRPQCVICLKVLTNESLKPSKLKEHLMKRHPLLAGKSRGYFEGKSKQLRGIQFGSGGMASEKLTAAVEVSYEVAYRIAQSSKNHTIAEDLIMPCTKLIVSKMCGEDQAKKLEGVSVSNTTIRRRVDDLAADILAQVVAEVKASPHKMFSLQFDESTDVSSCAVLLGYVRYIHEYSVKEEFLLAKNLKTTTKGEDIFNLVNDFLGMHGLEWNNVQQISVDGCPAMMGGNRGFRGFVQRENSDIHVDHCALHRYSLASKSLPESLKIVFDQAVKVVNFIKAKELNSRLFKELCKEMGQKYEALLYHTEVRWLSRGKVITRLFELREAVEIFLIEKKSGLAEYFSDPHWIAQLGYLADIFVELNKGNLSIQGKCVTVIHSKEAVAAFIAKMKLWIKRVNRGVLAQFPTLDMYLEGLETENEPDFTEALKGNIADHLGQLVEKMEEYFPDLDTTNMGWLTEPFRCLDSQVDDDDFPAKEEFIALRMSEALKIDFKEKNLDAFWIERLQDAPTLATRALNVLISFSTSYRCEQGFSTIVGLKTKKRNRLDVENDARIALSTTKPRIAKLVVDMQAQPSH